MERTKIFISSVQSEFAEERRMLYDYIRQDALLGKFIEVLTHLNLIKENRISNAAILLFGKKPQKFFICSEVRCAMFPTNDVTKPITSYQVYKGDIFELVMQATQFVMSNIRSMTGVRDKGVEVDVEYELPLPAVTEAIVNAVCHRDYTSNASVQVMLFPNRLEVWNPGQLPFGMTIAKLKAIHSSIPVNPLLAEPMYLNGTIERMGTGTRDIVHKCKELGLKEPEFIQDEFFRSILWRKEIEDEKATEKATETTNNLTKNQILIIEEIKINPYITSYQIAQIIGIRDDNVRKNLMQLKSRGIIERVGAAKDGYWKILSEETTDRVPDSLTDNQKTILEHLQQNNRLSMNELATILGISKRKILDNINKLRDLDLLKREGNNKNGYWEIINSSKKNEKD